MGKLTVISVLILLVAIIYAAISIEHVTKLKQTSSISETPDMVIWYFTRYYREILIKHHPFM